MSDRMNDLANRPTAYESAGPPPYVIVLIVVVVALVALFGILVTPHTATVPIDSTSTSQPVSPATPG